MESIKVKMPGSSNDLVFNSPAMRWDEALPLGNGLAGCLVWGDGQPLKLSLDRGDLWDNRPAQETLSKDFTYKKLIELVGEKDQDAVRKRFDSYYHPTPTKIPAGRLEINFGRKPDRLESRLVLDSAVVEAVLSFGDGSFSVKIFLHAERKFGWIRMEGDGDLPAVRIAAPDFGIAGNEQSDEDTGKREIPKGSLKQLAYPLREWGGEGKLRWFVQKTAEEFEYGIFLKEKSFDHGKDLVFYIGCSNDGEAWRDNAKRLVDEALPEGYEKVLESHRAWWKSFWTKSSLSLPEEMFEKQWYLTNYLFGSCSRKGSPPMPLQGVWTADEGELPPWKGDYHNDLNTQMSYWHYLKANHMEEGESFIDFLRELMPEARKFARYFFDAPGLCLPSAMTIKGRPVGGWPMYSFTLTNQIWLCQAFEMHWRYTGEDDFLREKGYPYFKETALCVMRWLKPDENGKLKLPLSSSPEIHDDGLEAWLKPNSNYDLSLLIYLFKTLAEISDVLQNGEGEVWRQKLQLLDSLTVNEHKVLMLSCDESLKESHRHLSHAMAVYPLRLLDYNTSERDREIIDATVSNLELLGTGLWIGFSFTWMAELYAVQGNGEGAAYQLKLFWENFCSPNGFNLNGDYRKRGVSWWHYRPFTLEANMCAADALQEMLLKTEAGVIRVFPAIPQEWKRKSIAFHKFRGWNGILVSAEMKAGRLVSIVLEASKTGRYAVHNSFNLSAFVLGKNGRKTMVSCEIGENMIVDLGAGEMCSIDPEFHPA